MVFPTRLVVILLSIIGIRDETFDPLGEIPCFVIQNAKSLPHAIGVFARKAKEHGLSVIIAGSKEVVRFRKRLLEHCSKIRSLNIPMILKLFNRFPLVAFTRPVVRQVTEVGLFDFLQLFVINHD